MSSTAQDMWRPFDDGRTIGLEGSEGGTVLLDEEHPAGARITLESNGAVAPFAITCGIYGDMMHTRFVAKDGEARRDYALMRAALGGMLADREARGRAAYFQGVKMFVEQFP